ncbi:MAG TPA: AsmA family protein [Roseiarcus sp.]|nr:AsmA family protein [Roseiarcus sp.]
MRVFLTSLAVLLIAALSAALVVPYFIDWRAHRAAIETELTRALGLPVKLNGSIRAVLLPTPYVKLADLSIGDDEGTPVFSCGEARLELALAPLVHGEFRFTDATFEGARLQLHRNAAGAIVAPLMNAAVAPDSIGLDSISFREASIALAGTKDAPAITIEGLNLDANADSLRGPFRGAGKGKSGDTSFVFHFATGALKGEALPIKFVADFGAAPHAEFDGALRLSGAAPSSFVGSASLSGAAPTPWRLSGALSANLNGARFEQFEARLGADERALSLQGSAEARFSPAPRVNAILSAKELNVDALLRNKGADSTPPERAAEALAALLPDAGFERGPPIPVSIKIDAPAIILGGDTIADAALEANAAPGAPVTVKLEATPPGGGAIKASGEIELGPAAHFKGPVEASLDDIAHFREWLSQDDADLRARLDAIGAMLAYRSASLSGDVDISGASFAARKLKLTLAKTILAGDVTFTRAVGADRARLFMDLKTDALDLDALPNLDAGGGFLSNVDLSIALEANALRIARLGDGGFESGSLALRLAKTGDDVTLDHLQIANLGGASLEAAGALKSGERWLNVDLNAERLRDFALLMRRIAPDVFGDALVERAGPLSPAKLTFAAKASGPVKDSLWTPDSLTVRGALGATEVNGALDRAPAGGLAAKLSLEAPEVSALLRQLGVAATPLTGLGRGSIDAHAEGDWSKGFSANTAASLAGVDLTWSGRALGTDSAAEGALKLKGANVLPLLSALGIVLPDANQSAAADLAAGLTWRNGEIALSQIKGAFAHANVLGDLSYRLQPVEGDGQRPAPQLDGSLALDRVALGGLASLALGPPQPAKAGAPWSDLKFTSALANPPTSEIAMKIGTLDLTNDLAAHNATMNLKIQPGAVAFDDLDMAVAGGTAKGQATLRRDGANAALSGKIAVDSIAVDRPGFTMQFAGSMDFASTGSSASALVGGLAGSGEIRLSGAELRRLDPDALSRVVAAAQAPDFELEQIDLVRLLARELDRRAMRIVDAAAPASLTAGVIRAGPFDAKRAEGEATAQIGFDLRDLGLDIHVAVNEKQAPKFWNGAPPAIAVALEGAPGALTRKIDAASLSNGLEAQAITRESERIADVEADIRERAYFNRVLKASRAMRQRELDLEAYAADQARLRSEIDRHRVEEAALRAADERKAADEARKALEDARKASDISPPLPPDASPAAPAAPSIIAPAVAPSPPPRPRTPPDPTAGGIY